MDDVKRVVVRQKLETAAAALEEAWRLLDDEPGFEGRASVAQASSFTADALFRLAQQYGGPTCRPVTVPRARWLDEPYRA